MQIFQHIVDCWGLCFVKSYIYVIKSYIGDVDKHLFNLDYVTLISIAFSHAPYIAILL